MMLPDFLLLVCAVGDFVLIGRSC